VSKHKIRLNVSFFMDEMDGEPEDSAGIAVEILEWLLRENTAWEIADVGVSMCYEVQS
jgi:hypothetical protein